MTPFAAKPQLHRFGASQSPVVVIDGFSGAVPHLRAVAQRLAPFGRSENNVYPGLRRVITPGDTDANAYIERTLEAAAPFIGGAFDIDAFDWDEASFSMVTDPPSTLSAQQRAPHFDRLNDKYLAILHYLSDTPDTGTAFYRHRATAIEQVTPGNVAAFVETAKRENALAAPPGYITASNDHYEQIGRVAAVPDRLVIYRGCQLHSGIIPPDMAFSDDPATGRLTANIFIQGR